MHSTAIYHEASKYNHARCGYRTHNPGILRPLLFSLMVTVVLFEQEVVGRFENQGETRRQLEEMKAQNEKHIARLREESEKLQSQFEEMKYTGEAKLSRYNTSTLNHFQVVTIILNILLKAATIKIMLNSKVTLTKVVETNVTFRPASTGLHHALVACDLTQISASTISYLSGGLRE